MHTEPSTVRNVSVISTGSGSIHPEHMYGSRKPAYWWILANSIPATLLTLWGLKVPNLNLNLHHY